MIYGRETIEGIQDEIRPLLPKHYEEIAPFSDIPLDPDFSLFLRAEALGMLRVFTARTEEGALVGYAFFFFRAHQHYQKSVQATLDLLFLDPEYRGPGKNFLQFVDRELQSEGVDVINFVVTKKCDYSPLLKRMGYFENEVVFSKRVAG